MEQGERTISELTTQRDRELANRINGWFGTGMLALASFTLVVILADRLDMAFIPMPALWNQAGDLQIVICLMFFAFAAILLIDTAQLRTSQVVAAVKTVCVYTKDDCPLCDKAIAVLRKEAERLPLIEIVDITDDAELMQQYGQSVPVVEINGRVRFRGAVHPVLLRRLLDGMARQGAAETGSDSSNQQETGTPFPKD